MFKFLFPFPGFKLGRGPQDVKMKTYPRKIIVCKRYNESHIEDDILFTKAIFVNTYLDLFKAKYLYHFNYQ